MKRTKKSTSPPTRSKHLPATQGMLYEFREEMRAEFKAQSREISSRFKEHESRFDKVDARFKEVEARFDKVDARFDRVDMSLHQIKLLVEEQNARNKFVLDSLVSLFYRQDRVEKEFEEFKKTFSSD